MAEAARNGPCPCGSGLKYKRCCADLTVRAAIDAREAERVWAGMQTWALDRFDEELMLAMAEHMDARRIGNEERPANEHDLSLALCWLLIDRPLAGGGVPASLYAELPELTVQDRAMAERIAASGLGLYRVSDARAGEWIELQDVLDATDVRVSSPLVSQEAVRWHVLLCRVMRGGPTPSLWGAAAFYEPAEEAELAAELQRIATTQALGEGVAGLRAALRAGAGELVCFCPPSRHAEHVPYTLEGDPVVLAEAEWRLSDPRRVAAALAQAELVFGGPTEDGDGVQFDWLASRRELLARRPPLPPGAIIIEGSPVQVDARGRIVGGDHTTLGTFTVRVDRLEFFAMSAERLDGAVAFVERVLGPMVGKARRGVSAVDAARAAHGHAREGRADGRRATGGRSGAPDARMLEFTSRRWLDDPNERLGGLSPREAASRPEHRAELERQLRNLEYFSARDRVDGRPAPKVSRLRAELGLGGDWLAA